MRMQLSGWRWLAVVGTLGATVAVVAACVGDTGTAPGADASDAGGDGPSAVDASASALDGGSTSDGNTTDGGGTLASRIVAISAGFRHACAIDDVGDLWCWGDNTYGQLGVPLASTPDDCVGDNGTKRKCRAKPARVPGLTDVRQVSAGLSTCAVVGAAADVYCWGDNRTAQLGHASGAGDGACLDTDGTTNACNPTPTKVENLTDVVQVSQGAYHTCARNKANAAFCWGDNRLGAIGNEVANDTAVPTPTAPSGVPPVIDIRAGFNGDTCAVSVSGGEVWCWGFDDWNQLGFFFGVGGDQSCSQGLGCHPKPRRAQNEDGGANLGGQALAYPGHSFSCSQEINGGKLHCWGLRSIGTFADGDLTPQAFPELAIPIAAPLRAFDSRWENSCAISASGDLSCWGQGGTGSLGNGSVAESDAGYTPLPVASPKALAAVSGGYRFFVVRDSAGAVWSFGANYSGALGHAQGTGGDAPCGLAADVASKCNGTPAKVTGLPGTP